MLLYNAFVKLKNSLLILNVINCINEAIEKCNIEKKDSLTASFKILVEKIWPDEAMHNESNKRHFP